MKTILATAALPAIAGSANASVCIPNSVVARDLLNGFGEVLVATAMSRETPLMIFANAETGTFTVVVVGPEASCVVSAGSDFEIIMQGDPA